jgi:hypothetical protein
MNAIDLTYNSIVFGLIDENVVMVILTTNLGPLKLAFPLEVLDAVVAQWVADAEAT